MPGAFDFNLLDDALAACDPSRKVTDALRQAQVKSIGPLVEYAIYRNASREHLPGIGEIDQCEATARLLAMPGRTSLVPLSCEFQPPPTDGVANDPRWIAFCKRAENAAACAGFSKSLARGFVGAIGEMSDNIVLHSEQATSGIVGYQWRKGEFEYTVGDKGIGVLASLRKNPTYEALRDHGKGLELALTDHVSSLGDGRGTGFQQLFKSLANLGALLRFRSGDHALTIQGSSPGLHKAKLLQLPNLEGFVISVICRPM